MAVAALGLSACTGEKLVPDNGNADGKFVTVHFGAEAAIEGATKATLTTEDEKTFKSAWENGDVLSVEYSNDNTPVNKGIVPATWTADHFETKLPEYNGMWAYNVVYPTPDAEGAVDFGSARTQKGNAYNSKYDLMKGGAIETGADAGMTADGKNIVFNMTRQTAIAYFHLTSTLDEEVVSAKLSVEGGNIASSLVMVSETEYSKGFDLSVEDLNEITITFEEGTAPKASNFQLWYNVLPTKYTKMTLTVETANHTLTISRTAADNYAAGKLYKVVKNTADKWVKKVTANDGSLEHPYTAAEAIAAIDANTDLKGKYVKGIVKEVVSHNSSYGSMVYNIESGEKILKIFNGYDFGHTKFLGTDDLKVGDEVVVFGDLFKYNNTDYELNTDNYLISINGKTEIYRGLAVSGQKTAFTVGNAFEFGGKALQVWRGKEDVDVTTSATFSGYDMSTEGKQTVTVTVGEETVTYEIIVRAAGATSYFVKVTTAPTDWSGEYLIVFGKKAYSYVAKKDLISKSPSDLTIVDDKIESTDAVNVDIVTIEKSTNGYKIRLSDGKYLSVLALNACGANNSGSELTITLDINEKDNTINGVSISGVDSKNATRTLCNNGTYYRMYPSVGSYKLPQLYKLDN